MILFYFLFHVLQELNVVVDAQANLGVLLKLVGFHLSRSAPCQIMTHDNCKVVLPSLDGLTQLSDLDGFIFENIMGKYFNYHRFSNGGALHS